MSRAFAKADQDEARLAFASASELALVLSLPVGVLLAVGANVTVSGLFGYGALSANDVRLTSAIVSAYALGIPAAILIRCLVPTFQAKGDTTSPTIVAAFVLIVSITLKIILAEPLGAAGIAAATSVASWISLGFLTLLAIRVNLIMLDPRLKALLWRAILGSALAGLTFWLFATVPQMTLLFEGRSPWKAAALSIIGLIAIIVYGLVLLGSGYRRHSIVLQRWNRNKVT